MQWFGMGVFLNTAIVNAACDEDGVPHEDVPHEDEGVPNEDEDVPHEDEGVSNEDEGVLSEDESWPNEDEGVPHEGVNEYEGVPNEDGVPMKMIVKTVCILNMKMILHSMRMTWRKETHKQMKTLMCYQRKKIMK